MYILVQIILAGVLLGGCAATPPSGVLEMEPEMEIMVSEKLSTIHQLPGQKRETLEASWGAPVSQNQGWFFYEGGLEVLYLNHEVDRLRVQVPEDLGCVEAIHRLGFVNARTPLLKKRRCVWPYQSPQHGVAPGLTANMVLGEHVLEVGRHP